MYFDDDFIKTLPDDSREAIITVCNHYVARRNHTQVASQKHQLALEVYALLQVLLPARGLPSIEVKITGVSNADRESIDGFINDIQKKMQAKIHVGTLDEYKRHFGIKFASVFHYEFSDGDFKKIQELINDLRTLISEASDLEADHRHRLLKRLEALQAEFHKKVSDLDRFWGFFIDASIVVGLMGENAKPMVDVIKKIVTIIWPTQTRAYELPSDMPFKLLGQSEGKLKG